MQLVELVPNVSEGKSLRAVQSIADAFVAGGGLWLLDVHRDPTHHRSVFTAVARPEAAAEAALRLAERCLERIDLRRHRGAHPRIGALDVLPFVGLAGLSPESTVALARGAGERLARDLGLPVFLYGDAASDPQKRELSFLRRGGFESLSERMSAGELVPDFGPRKPHPTAGATAVGVRRFLIAFNVNLESRDLASARAIAREIRESSGGFPHVKAIGVDLRHRGVVQVSMNLTDYRVTPLRTVFRAVSAYARRLGIAVESSEIVGLVPEAATYEGMTEEMKLRGPPGVLEESMRKAGIA